MTDPYIVTYTGKRLPLMHPDPNLICVEDIAHALSMQCRFTGHTRLHYSVAEHSIRVAWSLGLGPSASPRARLTALLHDGAEAYLGDVSTPLKQMLPQYRELENRWQHAVFLAFKLDDYTAYLPAVQAADRETFEQEVCRFFPDPEAFGVTPRDNVQPRVGYAIHEAEELFLRYAANWACGEESLW